MKPEASELETSALYFQASLPDIEAGQVLVEIKACGLSTIRTDVLQELGLHENKTPLGRDISGIVTHGKLMGFQRWGRGHRMISKCPTVLCNN